MAFDSCEHRIRQIIIKAAILRRKEGNLPEDNNITTLYNEMAPLLGISVVQMNSRDANHLPSPSEMKNEKGEFIIPNKICPKCGKITFLSSICQSCEAAENGLYKTGYTCDERSGGCGFVDEKTGEFYSQRLSRMGKDVPTGTKESLGIKTATDDGLK
jgi:ribosomal protein L32